jgi:transposase
VGRYAQAFKDRAVARLLPPESAPVQTVSRELGVSMACDRAAAGGHYDGGDG